MRSELKYKIEVEPIMHQVLDQMASDAAQFGIEVDELLRATYSWAGRKVSKVDPEAEVAFHQGVAKDAYGSE